MAAQRCALANAPGWPGGLQQVPRHRHQTNLLHVYPLREGGGAPAAGGARPRARVIVNAALLEARLESHRCWNDINYVVWLSGTIRHAGSPAWAGFLGRLRTGDLMDGDLASLNATCTPLVLQPDLGSGEGRPVPVAEPLPDIHVLEQLPAAMAVLDSGMPRDTYFPLMTGRNQTRIECNRVQPLSPTPCANWAPGVALSRAPWAPAGRGASSSASLP